ncbi:TetR/AcrR family transcriptional regulator [Skermanella mucosa]|uniref:TetR/AcrR family transcriptional regulator n=1 Tax=Skermanella mucosa TaxID=1789672 RepID=UPI00192C49A2|nr:TetR/AcrR family transcriptional regulator [Skermanella mucosa]UEM19292.1 TetR/AcrR family transcriptional regulator [Skermanella mucosa]
MIETRTRRRQPEVTQQRLLEVAGELVGEAGVAALTIEAVAKRAGVSKGGLLHHFPSKQALLAAMVETMAERFARTADGIAAQDPDLRGRSARAYVRTAVSEPDEELRRWAALSAAFMSDPSLLDGWRDRLKGFRAVDEAECEDPVGALVARLAADGLWFADVCGLYDIDAETRRLVADRLVALTRS